MASEITLDFGENLSFNIDVFWLRDHCRCKICYDHSTNQRKLSILDIPDDISVKSLIIKDDSAIITCEYKSFIKNNLKHKINNHKNENLKGSMVMNRCTI